MTGDVGGVGVEPFERGGERGVAVGIPDALDGVELREEARRFGNLSSVLMSSMKPTKCCYGFL